MADTGHPRTSKNPGNASGVPGKRCPNHNTMRRNARLPRVIATRKVLPTQCGTRCPAGWTLSGSSSCPAYRAFRLSCKRFRIGNPRGPILDPFIGASRGRLPFANSPRAGVDEDGSRLITFFRRSFVHVPLRVLSGCPMRRQLPRIALIGGLVLAAGCATRPIAADLPQPRRLPVQRSVDDAVSHPMFDSPTDVLIPVQHPPDAVIIAREPVPRVQRQLYAALWRHDPGPAVNWSLLALVIVF